MINNLKKILFWDEKHSFRCQTSKHNKKSDEFCIGQYKKMFTFLVPGNDHSTLSISKKCFLAKLYIKFIGYTKKVETDVSFALFTSFPQFLWRKKI